MNIIKPSIVCLLLALVNFTSCKKEEEKANTPEFVNISFTPGVSDMLVATGSFNNNAIYPVKGQVQVYENNNYKLIRFENFSSSNGPNLKVYLCKTDTVTDYISIGDLQAISGNFNYVISVLTNIAEYKYVLIYDENLKSIYGFAELM